MVDMTPVKESAAERGGHFTDKAVNWQLSIPGQSRAKIAARLAMADDPMVAFVEGDPDRPFIVGSVPNPITPSPVVRSNAIMNRIESATGILIEMKDI